MRGRIIAGRSADEFHSHATDLEQPNCRLGRARVDRDRDAMRLCCGRCRALGTSRSSARVVLLGMAGADLDGLRRSFQRASPLLRLWFVSGVDLPFLGCLVLLLGARATRPETAVGPRLPFVSPRVRGIVAGSIRERRLSPGETRCVRSPFSLTEHFADFSKMAVEIEWMEVTSCKVLGSCSILGNCTNFLPTQFWSSACLAGYSP
jgi:hypothetical protein